LVVPCPIAGDGPGLLRQSLGLASTESRQGREQVAPMACVDGKEVRLFPSLLQQDVPQIAGAGQTPERRSQGPCRRLQQPLVPYDDGPYAADWFGGAEVDSGSGRCMHPSHLGDHAQAPVDPSVGCDAAVDVPGMTRRASGASAGEKLDLEARIHRRQRLHALRRVLKRYPDEGQARAPPSPSILARSIPAEPR
jgi:hypothetical protein